MPADRIPAEIRKVLIAALPKENAPAALVNAEPPPVVVYPPSGYDYPRYGYGSSGYYPAYYGAYRVR